ncbi:hypothetical protein [Nitrosomonas sp. Nm132]|nr:hypothetical protein [Nitrosomonas sp. Nm132]
MTDLITTGNRALTAKEFQGLAAFPPKLNGSPIWVIRSCLAKH